MDAEHVLAYPSHPKSCLQVVSAQPEGKKLTLFSHGRGQPFWVVQGVNTPTGDERRTVDVNVNVNVKSKSLRRRGLRAGHSQGSAHTHKTDSIDRR